MIQNFSIKNFKSLFIEKPITLTEKLNVFIGVNGAGKSTFLQAIDFVTHLVLPMGYREWMEGRQWQAADLTCKLKKQGEKAGNNHIEYDIAFDTNKLRYNGIFSVQKERCIEESISTENGGKEYSCKVSAQSLSIPYLNYTVPADFLQHQGSVFGLISPPEMSVIHDIFGACRSLELLNPRQMRSRVRAMSTRGVGIGGEQLSLFLHTLPKKDQDAIVDVMKRFYPTFQVFKIVKLRGGAKRLEINESFSDGSTLISEAQHVCDGVLRVLAIVAETFACKGGTVLIDEIDDGINPELMEKLIEYLKTEAPCQTLVTTHNPFILSCLSDKEAEDTVFLTYKKANGRSSVVPFFSQPEPKKLLKGLYPGEVMLQVNLETVAEK